MAAKTTSTTNRPASRITKATASGTRGTTLLNGPYPLIWFALAAFLLFGRSIGFTYTYFDDHTLVLNQMENLKSGKSISQAFNDDVFNLPGTKGDYYRPLLTLSFVLDATIGSGSFAFFHFSNILWHILAVWIFFLVLVAMGFNRPRSFLAALVFLVHPIATQVVAWVPGRNDSMLAVFVLASFLFWLRYSEKGRLIDLTMHTLLFACALFTKENAVVLPVMVVLYGSTILRYPVKKYVPLLICWIIAILPWALMRSHAIYSGDQATLAAQALSVLKSLPAVLPFLGKIFFPVGLSVFPILADMMLPLALGVVALLLLAWLSWNGRLGDRRWLLLFGAVWFLAFLLPSFIQIYQKVPNFSEHRAYLPLAGILMMLPACRIPERIRISGGTSVVAASAAILILASVTFFHVGNFSDRMTFWKEAVASSPHHAFNLNNLGAMYFLEGDLASAEPLFRKALEANPAEPMAAGNAGLVCMRTGRAAEAEKFFLDEIRINPSYDHAHFNLGILLYNNGRHQEAVQQWEETIRINPGYYDAYDGLLFAYRYLGRQADYDRVQKAAEAHGIHVTGTGTSPNP